MPYISRAAFLALLRQTGEQAAGTAAKAAKPELDKFKAAVDSAAAVQLQLRAAVKDFQRQWAWVVAFAIGGIVLAAALVAYGAVWWQLREVGQLQAQRQPTAQRSQRAASAGRLGRAGQAE